MSLQRWKDSGWLREHKTSAQEITGLLALVGRDLADAARQEVSTDWRFNIAYNAGLQLATLVLYAAGYRAGRGESKHYRVIQAIPLVMGVQFSTLRDYLDNCRRKRNVSEYDAVGMVSEKEAEDLISVIKKLESRLRSGSGAITPSCFRMRVGNRVRGRPSTLAPL